VLGACSEREGKLFTMRAWVHCNLVEASITSLVEKPRRNQEKEFCQGFHWPTLPRHTNPTYVAHCDSSEKFKVLGRGQFFFFPLHFHPRVLN
jgi:hypothetical protein